MSLDEEAREARPEPPTVTARVVILLGATGLVGGHCLALLQQDESVTGIRVLSRRPLSPSRLGVKTEPCHVDFEHLRDHRREFTGDQILICLGTTRKDAGSRDAFVKVDYGYTLECARLAAERRVTDLLVVSALGAHPHSLFFYSRVKGRLEGDLARLPFRSVTVLRPSALLGERPRPRRGERLLARAAPALGLLLPGPLAKYRPIPASDVARAMVYLAGRAAPGYRCVESHEISALAAAAAR